ncbi:IS1249 family transposase [Raoultibacter massiliensis]|uniref:IS1249 family transposase n=1 Tax=Raoultibacter massiliensis TaxID=1852371 RepID=A0ABV1JDK5_9ACTN|nr:IS1249 family transposase [Raoultibacter massiliensis]
MDNPKCTACGGAMKRNGRTSAGAQRRRCGASMTHRIDASAKALSTFLAWLFSKRTQGDFGCSSRTFRRKAERFWETWPLPSYTGEVCDVVFLDGIWVSGLVVLIACTKEHVLAWHLAESECSGAWAALMAKLAPPVMAVSDGGPGFAKAARAMWPETRIQRCTFHVFRQVRRCTTSRPKLQAGKELYGLARDLLKARDADAAAKWLAGYAEWCAKWESFLREFAFKDGKRQYVHRELRKARRALNGLVQTGTLFTFIEIAEERGGEWDSTSNVIEGGVNARLREMVRNHRGLSRMRRVKAMFWWCYMHAEAPLPAAEILRVMPTDDEVAGLFAMASKPKRRDDGAPEEYESGVAWGEFYAAVEYHR